MTTEKINLTNKLGLFNFICACIALCTTVVGNTAQNRPDNLKKIIFPLALQAIIHCPDYVYLREGVCVL